MANNTKTEEWKVRGPQGKDVERQDQANVCRVQLDPDAMKELHLRPEQTCLLWRVDEPDIKYESIAWNVPTSSPKHNKDLAVFYDTNRKRCGFELRDRICISAGGQPPNADSVFLRDISHELPNHLKTLAEKYRNFWEWGLERGCLSKSFVLRAVETSKFSGGYGKFWSIMERLLPLRHYQK